MCRVQIKINDLQASLTSAETAHSAAQSTIVAVTTERDDLKEAVATLRRRIRDLETTVSRSTTEVQRQPCGSALRLSVVAVLCCG